MTKIVVLGANGQVGRALCALLGDRAVGLTHAQADLGKPETLSAQLDRHSPSAIINAAAYTAVDKAEEEEKLAHIINAEAPGALAAYCKSKNIPLVHYSTDYVFNGGGEAAWKETDKVAPLSAYGRSKLAGEQAIENVGGKYLIFRTSWVYDAAGKNFLNTMLRLGGEREELRIVQDQHGAPTFAGHLAEATVQALENAIKAQGFPSGIYHLCNAGVTTWYDFALNIFEAAKAHAIPIKVKSVHGITTAEYPLPAKRPHNSRLDCSKAQTILGVSLPKWEEGLAACMKEKVHNERNRLSA